MADAKVHANLTVKVDVIVVVLAIVNQVVMEVVTLLAKTRMAALLVMLIANQNVKHLQ